MDSNSLLINGLCTLVGGVAGWFACIYLSKHPAMLNLREQRADRKAERMTTGNPKPGRDRYGLAIVVFLAALLVISGQAIVNQRAESSRNDAEAARNERARENQAQLIAFTGCTSDWGKELVKTIRRRAQANKAVEKAKTVRDDAVDHVFDVVILARRVPPEAGVDEFDQALRDYARAKKRLVKVQADLDATRQANEYTQLTCTLPETASEAK